MTTIVVRVTTIVVSCRHGGYERPRPRPRVAACARVAHERARTGAAHAGDRPAGEGRCSSGPPGAGAVVISGPRGEPPAREPAPVGGRTTQSARPVSARRPSPDHRPRRVAAEAAQPHAGSTARVPVRLIRSRQRQAWKRHRPLRRRVPRLAPPQQGRDECLHRDIARDRAGRLASGRAPGPDAGPGQVPPSRPAGAQDLAGGG